MSQYIIGWFGSDKARLTRPDILQRIRRFAPSCALFLLIFGRLLLQGVVRSAGFEALTADDFGRVVIAAKWAMDPHPIWHGPWLPFHTYFVGFALKLCWELLWIPRLIGNLAALLSLGLVYLLSFYLFRSRLAALTSAMLLALNPAHIWLALTPLTELLNFTLLVTCLLWLVRYENERQNPFLLFSLPPLVIATATRFESWLFGAAVALHFTFGAMYSLFRTGRCDHNWLAAGAIGAAVALFPVAWIFGNYLETGGWLVFPARESSV